MLALFFGTKVPLIDVVQAYWSVFPVALAVSLVATPICRRLAVRINLMDYPDAEVKTHGKPTAYLGGLGILAGVGVGLLVGIFLVPEPDVVEGVVVSAGRYGTYWPDWLMLLGIGFGAIVACGVGVVDDVVDLRPWQKLLGQVMAATILLTVGIRPNISGVLVLLGIDVPRLAGLAIDFCVVMFFLLGAMNSVNLLDGLDGLCAGVTAIGTVGLMLLAVGLATWRYSPIGDPVRLVVCLSLVGGTLGFLPMNRHPASIFMGDAGSMLIGFAVGTVMILFCESVGRWSVSAIIIFWLPILDTGVALVRRFVNKRPLFVSDRGHIYDQLMDRGWSLKKTVRVYYIMEIVCVLVGLVVSQMRFRYALIVFVGIVLLSGLLTYRHGFLQMDSKSGD